MKLLKLAVFEWDRSVVIHNLLRAQGFGACPAANDDSLEKWYQNSWVSVRMT